MEDNRWFHGLDKAYGGSAHRDVNGAAAALLDLSARWRFDPGLVEFRIAAWAAIAGRALDDAEQTAADDPIGAWAAIRRAGTRRLARAVLDSL